MQQKSPVALTVVDTNRRSRYDYDDQLEYSGRSREYGDFVRTKELSLQVVYGVLNRVVRSQELFVKRAFTVVITLWFSLGYLPMLVVDCSIRRIPIESLKILRKNIGQYRNIDAHVWYKIYVLRATLNKTISSI